ncbi:MAG TPA: GNAT family N-acetyltransferase [Candidatus Hydrogenedentes bacterium]|nr:MAG: Acetyltransferase (GNAT) family protein [Candidatus Hydrogenedentes bacterium ADurb.Bin179]HOH28662.1 GNAT family N-acetyltransferase [Candidatus Hydrogenedentota bacterium]
MEVIPILKEHAEAAGHALARAFMDDPVDSYILPDPARREKLLHYAFPRWVWGTARRGHAYTTSDFAGAALWRSPELSVWIWVWDQFVAGLWQAPFLLYPKELLRLRQVHTEAMNRMRASITSPHWVLDVLGVSPDRQGEGISRKLLEPALARADAERLPCYLITNKEKNIAIYGRFGFQVIKKGLMSGTEVMFYELRRPALLNK